MRSKLQQFGLIALGMSLGVMISLNFWLGRAIEISQ